MPVATQPLSKITPELVKQARNNATVYKQIERKIFYKNSQPVLRRYLARSLPSHLIDEYESEMRMILVICLHEYTHGKIPFEKFVWYRFKMRINVYYMYRNYDKVKKELIIEDFNTKIEGDFSDEYSEDALNIFSGKNKHPDNIYSSGLSSRFDTELRFDYVKLLKQLDKTSRYIMRYLFEKGYKKPEICTRLGISEAVYDFKLRKVQGLLKDYLC